MVVLLVPWWKRVFTGILLVAAVASLAGTFIAGFCAYSWQRNRLSDYGIYLNMMWNTAHGEPFRYLIDGSYLRIHLSYTVGLLGFAFRIVDHPILLVVLQWACSAVGTLILVTTARKLGFEPSWTAALAFFYAAYRFVQALLVHQFHGVALYLLLVPALYAALKFRSNCAWPLLALTLGIREDAFLVILPLLLHAALRDRRRDRWLMLAMSILYGFLAIFVIYPTLAGISIFEKRTAEIPSLVDLGDYSRQAVAARIRAIALVATPLLVAGRRFFTALFYPSFALAVSLASKWPSQYGLGSHYGASVVSTMAVGLLEALSKTKNSSDPPIKYRISPWFPPLWLAGVTILVHLESGFLWGGGKSRHFYYLINERAMSILAAAKHIPKDGVLITSDELVAFCGNRRDLMVWHIPSRPKPYDHVFAALGDLPKLDGGRVWSELQSGVLGVRFSNGRYAVLSRGFDTRANQEVLEFARHRLIHGSARHGGMDLMRGDLPVRYWEGDGSRAPINLSHGRFWRLDPGVYSFTLEYVAETPRRSVRKTWGWFSLHLLNSPEELARAEIPPVAGSAGDLQTLDLEFTNSQSCNIEFRVTGGDAPLWLYRVKYHPR